MGVGKERINRKYKCSEVEECLICTRKVSVAASDASKRKTEGDEIREQSQV